MGKVASRLTRPIRLFNIENRANRALEKQQAQGIAAPKHPSTAGNLSQIQNDHPEFLQEQYQRNETLHENLKGLYVESDRAPEERNKSHRPLPESRKANPETELGIMETFHTIPEGRANLKTIIQFISQHQLDSTNVTAKSIAQEHTLNEEEVEKILNHFKALTLHIPQEMYKQNSNLKKIVAEQINSATTSVSQLRLSLPKEGSGDRDPDPKNS